MAARLVIVRRERAEASLYEFLQQAWPYLDPAPFGSNWHLGAMAEHLEAVNNGEIKRLVINIPPRHGKTSLITIAWPCWTWIQKYDPEFLLKGPQVPFLCASYGATKAEEDGVSARRLIGSGWFQENWGDRVVIAKDRDNQGRFDTTAGGSRINTGIPESLGKGGLIRIIDDPHKTKEVESQAVRQAVIRGYDEVWRTRSNDTANGAEVVVMQRLAADDLTGHLLDEDVVHLCLPAKFDPARVCSTVIGFTDPRQHEGEMLCPERFSAEWAEQHEKAIGPFAWAAQYQQMPESRGGTIIKRDSWQPWPNKQTPPLDYTMAVLDTGMTEKDSSDPSALIVMGSFQVGGQVYGDDYGGYDFIASNADRGDERLPSSRTNQISATLPKVYMVNAWRDRLDLPALAERVAASCLKYHVDVLVIENKAHGHAVSQALRQIFANKPFSIVMFEPRRYGDKSARLYAVQHLFAEGLIYAPGAWVNDSWYFKEWADMVIDECAQFPNGAHDDLADCVSMGLHHLRSRGFAPRREEVVGETVDRMRSPKRKGALYAV
jgi:predicted phage terminase large subunit-like protein